MAASPLFLRRRAELASRPPFLPPSPPLTIEQARQLVEEGQFPPDFQAIKEPIAVETVRLSTEKQPNKRRSFDVLLRLARHPCSKEVVEGNIQRIRKSSDELKSSGDEELAGAVFSQSVPYFAMIFADGYDEVSPTHFIFDKSGEVVGVVDKEKPRYPKCGPYLESQRSRWRPTGTHDGGKKKRQTKKKLHKKRKTSRRTRH